MKERIKEWWQAFKREQRIKRLVPYTCQYCELLGICRDEENGWKCHHGCMVLNAERREQEKREQKEKKERTYTLAEVERELFGNATKREREEEEIWQR